MLRNWFIIHSSTIKLLGTVHCIFQFTLPPLPQYIHKYTLHLWVMFPSHGLHFILDSSQRGMNSKIQCCGQMLHFSLMASFPMCYFLFLPLLWSHNAQSALSGAPQILLPDSGTRNAVLTSDTVLCNVLLSFQHTHWGFEAGNKINISKQHTG